MAETNNKFLQILRNFSSADRAAADQLLRAAAQGNLFHPGTPIVAFYNQNPESGNPKGETKTFPVRAQNGSYGTDVTRNYQALLGIMGQKQNEIEIFDIESSVEALLGGATKVSVSASGTHGAGTWDFRSLGGIQVVIEEMDQVIAASLTDLNDRITAITGQKGDTYARNEDAHYINDATSLQNAVDQLDAELYSVSQTVSVNNVSNADGSITVDKVTDPTKTDINVHIKTGEAVIAKNGNAGLYTDIKVIKLIPSGTAGENEEVDANLGSNVREAYKLLATDGTTQLGHRIDIYKDSALTQVYLGTMGDTLSGQDAQSGESASSTVVTGTGDTSLNFIYHLENGNYKMEKVNVETFLQESEFGNGLQVNDHVVSVKVDTKSESVITAYGATADDNTTVPVLSVGADGVKASNIQAAIDAAVAHGGTSIISSTMTALSDGTVAVAKTNQGNVNHIAIKQGTDASGAKTYEFLENDIASKAALDSEVTRAQSAETAIDGAIGLTKGANDETRSYTSQVTLKGTETAPTTVAGDIDLLDAHVEALNTALTGLDSSAGPSADSALAGFVQVDGKVYGAMTTMPSIAEANTSAATSTGNTYIKVTKTDGSAATITNNNGTVTTTDGTGDTYTIATTQALDDAIANAKTVVTGEANAAMEDEDPDTVGNGVYVTKTDGSGATPDSYLVAIDVFDCGEYTVS